MSGHNKWSKIKHKKAAEDAKKNKIFSKLSQQITLAAREGGGDIDANPSLRVVVDKAKAKNMPQSNIQKAIDRGTGEGDEGMIFEAVTYEGYGPAGVSVIVDALTDNKNRTLSEIRIIFDRAGGSLGEQGSVSWNFDTKGEVIVKCGKLKKAEKFGAPDEVDPVDKEEVIMQIMEIEGVEDIVEIKNGVSKEGCVRVLTGVGDRVQVQNAIEDLGYIINDVGIVKLPKSPKAFSEADQKKIDNFVRELDDHPDVQAVWS
ncbi:YebC/PmpR family DNA-binding transcriptional regulator [Candidatus Dojkabacteria bacterium]|nr:YebC/PmpR family DNA-binding transcriptional regulator [Candidatus Dojkabacteria bacterium]